MLTPCTSLDPLLVTPALQKLKPSPSLEAVTSLLTADRAKGNIVPIFLTLPADLVTPVIAYLRVAQGAKNSFLLESINGGENVSRYSFLGASAYPRRLPSRRSASTARPCARARIRR